jgi:hypothetical protein
MIVGYNSKGKVKKFKKGCEVTTSIGDPNMKRNLASLEMIAWLPIGEIRLTGNSRSRRLQEGEVEGSGVVLATTMN